jgi:hypothetical protein
MDGLLNQNATGRETVFPKQFRLLHCCRQVGNALDFIAFHLVVVVDARHVF